MTIHHAIKKAIEATGARIEEVTGRKYTFVLTHDDWGLRATGDDARKLRELAQKWAADEECRADYEVHVPEDDEDEEETKGSVVSGKYRARYKEAGHPHGCGDWLFHKLERLTKTGGKLDFEKLIELLELNGITDWRKWMKGLASDRGRVRMSGGQVLRRIVRQQGYMKTPAGDVKYPKATKHA